MLVDADRLAQMSNQLYRVIHHPELKVARIELPPPSMRLSPQQEIAKLKSHVQTLNEELKRHQQAFIDDQLDVPEAFEKMRRVILEIELAKHYIARARERYDEGPWASDMVNRLPSAA
jgi:hypothetical protein